MLPLHADPRPVERLEQLPVLFDLAAGEGLSRLVLEILRLGNDRQGLRWLETTNKNGQERALLRVVGPPYYSLLRAIDHRDDQSAPVAYLERAERVWVEWGHTHPLAERIRPPEGKMLLLRPPRQWTLLDDTPFRDVYEVLNFSLPESPARWREGKAVPRIAVGLGLKAGGPTDGAELWVLRERPVEELNRFAQNANEALLHRLAFAVGAKDGQTTVVVRVRPSKLPPPVLILDAIGYRTYLKLSNLFLPCGSNLHPQLRRDKVRQLLADDPARLTWLAPGDDGSFTPESLPEDAFRPLTDWVDYVLDHDRQELQAWVQASQFDFEPFVCAEDEARRPRKKESPAEKPTRGKKGGGSGPKQVFERRGDEREGPAATDENEAAFDPLEEAVRIEPNVLQEQLRAVEDRFLSFEGGLDAPERQALWPELARLNATLRHTDEAGVCWLHALWNNEAPTGWAASWFRTEALTSAAGRTREVNGEDLDKLLAEKEPATADVRALAAYLVWSGRRPAPTAPLMERLNRVRSFLEENEKLLPVRAVWLAWLHLARLAHDDVLTLARARDRLLERLFRNGLRPEQDLPGFLRFAGQPASQRFRAVRQWFIELCDKAHTWVKENGTDSAEAVAPMKAYTELIFAFGLARLGERDACNQLLTRAEKAMGKAEGNGKPAHAFLLRAFTYRIRQALEGKPNGGPFPAELAKEMETIDKAENKDRINRYVLDRMRKQSRILEPEQEVDPYQRWTARMSDLDSALAELTELSKDQVAERVQKLLRDTGRGAKAVRERARILREALNQAPRVNEDFARGLLDRVAPVYDALPASTEEEDLKQQAALLEKGMFVAAHFDHLDFVPPLVERFAQLLRTQRGVHAVRTVNAIAGKSFRSLRKLGMREEIDHLLREMADLVLGKQDLAALDPAKLDSPVETLQALLHVASGWYFFGRDREAEPVARAARMLLYNTELGSKLKLDAKSKAPLACIYAATVGQAPVELAQKRLEEMFDKLRGIKDTFTTAPYYSRFQLEVIEAVVLAVVSEDFTLGTQARRWLDEDEFLVRRRIHNDLRNQMT